MHKVILGLWGLQTTCTCEAARKNCHLWESDEHCGRLQPQVPGRQDLVQILGQPCQGEQEGQAEQPVFALVLPPLRWIEAGKETFKAYRTSCKGEKRMCFLLVLEYDKRCKIKVLHVISLFFPPSLDKAPISPSCCSSPSEFEKCFSPDNSVTLPVCCCLSATATGAGARHQEPTNKKYIAYKIQSQG